MRNLSMQFGNVPVLFRLVKGGRLHVTINGKPYMMSCKGEPTFIDKPDDLSEELQQRIFWAVRNYFIRKD